MNTLELDLLSEEMLMSANTVNEDDPESNKCILPIFA